MGFGGGGGSGRVKSDINVTPLVDVVLVLLIIFIVTMPVLLRDITIDIPKKAEQQLPDDPNPPVRIVVALSKESVLTLAGPPDGTPQVINRTELAEKLRARLDRTRQKVVFVDVDDAARYGDAVSIMDTCRGAGAETVAIKTKDEVVPAEPNP